MTLLTKWLVKSWITQNKLGNKKTSAKMTTCAKIAASNWASSLLQNLYRPIMRCWQGIKMWYVLLKNSTLVYSGTYVLNQVLVYTNHIFFDVYCLLLISLYELYTLAMTHSLPSPHLDLACEVFTGLSLWVFAPGTLKGEVTLHESQVGAICCYTQCHWHKGQLNNSPVLFVAAFSAAEIKAV